MIFSMLFAISSPAPLSTGPTFPLPFFGANDVRAEALLAALHITHCF